MFRECRYEVQMKLNCVNGPMLQDPKLPNMHVFFCVFISVACPRCEITRSVTTEGWKFIPDEHFTVKLTVWLRRINSTVLGMLWMLGNQIFTPNTYSLHLRMRFWMLNYGKNEHDALFCRLWVCLTTIDLKVYSNDPTLSLSLRLILYYSFRNYRINAKPPSADSCDAHTWRAYYCVHHICSDCRCRSSPVTTILLTKYDLYGFFGWHHCSQYITQRAIKTVELS